MKHIKIIECPRDAMQGIHHFIPTEIKADYINTLLKVGFDTLDFGSFVSPKAIPQMRDTADVLEKLDLSNSTTKLLAIVANTRGAEDATQFDQIRYLGFPFSISETFQQRNTNSSIEESLFTVEKMLSLCEKTNKEAVVYVSMGFGNPYGDPWNAEIVMHWTNKLINMGCKIISIADTTGMSTKENITSIMPDVLKAFPLTEIGVHLHSTPESRTEKIEAAFAAGCRRFDSALLGFGGCPMASDELTGNISTEDLIKTLELKGEKLGINNQYFKEAKNQATRIFL